MPLEIVFLEPQHWRPLKPLLKPYYRLHGKFHAKITAWKTENNSRKFHPAGMVPWSISQERASTEIRWELFRTNPGWILQGILWWSFAGSFSFSLGKQDEKSTRKNWELHVQYPYCKDLSLSISVCDWLVASLHLSYRMLSFISVSDSRCRVASGQRSVEEAEAWQWLWRGQLAAQRPDKPASPWGMQEGNARVQQPCQPKPLKFTLPRSLGSGVSQAPYFHNAFGSLKFERLRLTRA